MAHLHQYFDTDFSSAVGISIKLLFNGLSLEAGVFYDFSAYIGFFACYIPQNEFKLVDFIKLIQNIKDNGCNYEIMNINKLPPAKLIPGEIKAEVINGAFQISCRFHGDQDWISSKDIPKSERVFLYSENDLSDTDIFELKKEGKKIGLDIQFRSQRFAMKRSEKESPLAFISHDSRDKEDVARRIAVNLLNMSCPVWYDEFSLKIGGQSS